MQQKNLITSPMLHQNNYWEPSKPVIPQLKAIIIVKLCYRQQEVEQESRQYLVV